MALLSTSTLVDKCMDCAQGAEIVRLMEAGALQMTVLPDGTIMILAANSTILYSYSNNVLTRLSTAVPQLERPITCAPARSALPLPHKRALSACDGHLARMRNWPAAVQSSCVVC